jgi:hypothetical protein
VASVVAQMGPCLDYPRLQRVLQWLLGAGPLVDDLETVRTAFTNAGAKLVEKNGASCVTELYELFSARMSATVAVLSEGAAGDQATEQQQRPIDRDVRREDPAEVAQRAAQYVRLSCVIFIASIAVHMQPGDARINNIIHSLLDAQINSTSDLLQRSICHHLAPLMAMIADEEVPGYVSRLLKVSGWCGIVPLR